MICRVAADPRKLRLESALATADSTPREFQATTIFTLWDALDIPLSPIARDFVSQISDRGDRLAQGQVTSLQSAAHAGAVGEAALMVLALTQGDARTLAGPDQAVLLEALIEIGAKDVARDLALEITGFWKESE